MDGLPQPVTPVTGFAMTGFLQEVRCKSGGRVRAPRSTERFAGADDPVRPAPITQHLVGQGPCALPWVREKSGRAVGEIGEALPVAEEASRFRGSAPIGGHDSDRESVGTTVGNRRPLRTFYCGCGGAGDREGWTCRLRKISGDKYGDGLRSQCAHWLRNDIAQGSRRLAAKNRTGGANSRLCA